MKTKILLTGLAIALSTTLINADIEIEVVSGGVPINSNTIQMCIGDDEYIHFETTGSSNNTNGEIPSWTVNNDTYAYGDTFYFVPNSINDNLDLASYTVKLYDGMVINDTSDSEGSPLADEIHVNVINCN